MTMKMKLQYGACSRLLVFIFVTIASKLDTSQTSLSIPFPWAVMPIGKAPSRHFPVTLDPFFILFYFVAALYFNLIKVSALQVVLIGASS
jgi:hypothetical protein